jgi:exodeoxyribonuclease VII large subunit
MDRPLTVSEFLAALKGLLGESFASLAVEGEIGQMTRHRSGHWYMTLVDDGGALSAVMFRGDNSRVQWEPRVGDRVVAFGGADLYAPQGKLNFIVRRMEPSGEGARARALEVLKAKLAAEGLFDADRKKKLPFLPKAIGVATSPTGAAFQDILQILDRRFPGMEVLFSPCRVQGEGAGQEVANALDILVEHGGADVVIVGRGGGSAEDLWAFQEEVVVRAVARAPVPVVSAVGHETDWSLCDLAADVRAPTPSAAAELVVPELAALLQFLDEAVGRLEGGALRAVLRRREKLEKLKLLHPGERVTRVRVRAIEMSERLNRAANTEMERRRTRLGALAGRLDALSPLGVLGRGYALASKNKRLVRSAADLVEGDLLGIRFAEGRVEAKVTRVGD